MTNRNEGSKYETTRGLGVAAIAKLIRADIKALMPAGFKVSVKSDTYSMGRSIRATVTAVPAGFQYWTDEFLASDPRRFFEGERITSEAKVVMRALSRVLAGYNYNNSDSQSDYYDVSFSASVSFDHAVTRADSAARNGLAVAS